jgi:hypothetical protein
MESNGLIIVMAAAVSLSALALLAQAVMVFGMFKTIRALKEQVSTFLPQAEAFLHTGQKTMAEAQTQIREVTTKAVAVLDSTQNQLNKVDAFVGETTSRARVQMDRVEMVLDDTVSRVHDTVVQLNNGVVKPMRELTGIAAGFRATIHHFLRGNRPDVSQATSDEEMFI